MDVVRPISRSGDNATHNNNNSETELSVNPHAAVVPSEDTAVAPASVEDSNTTASDANNHAAVAVVVENPSEREERKDAVADDDDSEGDSEDEDEYEYEEDEDEAAFSSFLVDQPALTIAALVAAPANEEKPTKIEEDEVVPSAAAASARSWREPSREAVTMSLRAEKETSGSKRRLAQDLYRIMNKDTSETGFMLEPAVEDQMDQWKICLFQFDEDSMLAKDLAVLGLDSVELEMSFPEQYPFQPPFVRVVRPRFKRQTGFVMNGALCMELLTSDGWNPVNDIESVIVSIRSLLVVGEGRLEAASNMSPTQYAAALEAARSEKPAASAASSGDKKRLRTNSAGDAVAAGYSVSEAKAAYEHLSSYHKKKGWDQSGWWAKKG